MTTKESKPNDVVLRDAGTGVVASVGGVAVREAANVVYDAVGKDVLSEGLQRALKTAVVKVSAKVVEDAVVSALPDAARQLAPMVRGGAKHLAEGSARASTNLLASGGRAALSTTTSEGAKTVTSELVKATSVEAAKSAGKELLKGVGKTAGVGFAVDAVFGTIDAVQGVRSGKMSGKEAVVYVGKEAATGALATAVGAAACAGLVALTGPLGVGALLLVGAGTSFGTKRALRWLFN